MRTEVWWWNMTCWKADVEVISGLFAIRHCAGIGNTNPEPLHEDVGRPAARNEPQYPLSSCR